MNIAVLAGGISPERDVSLTSGSLIANALIRNGHRVCLTDSFLGDAAPGYTGEFTDKEIAEYRVPEDVPDLDMLRAKYGRGDALIGHGVIRKCIEADAVFIALHGAMGENGQLQATLDSFGIKYTGTGYDGSLLAMDKDLSKQIMVRFGVPTPEWIYADTQRENFSDIEKRITERIGLPCVIKPCSGGSSVGVTIVGDAAELDRAVRGAAEYERYILTEKKITGREITVAVLDGRVLPAIEIIPLEGFYDYRNKYQAGRTREVCPAGITDAQFADISRITLEAFSALRLRGYARFDYIMDSDGKFWCLEANTLPGMTPTSLLPQMAAAVGIGYDRLCETIINMAR